MLRIILTQFFGQKILRRRILLRIEASNLCTQISTSATFDPYRKIYTWLGQIRDSQLPAKMIIDEEGRGVELIVDRVNDEFLNFQIEPWCCGEDKTTRLTATVARYELIEAFVNGIVEFIRDEYNPSEWSNRDYLSNLNWQALLKSASIPGQNWQMRLMMYEGRYDVSADRSLEQQLTKKQKWLLILHDVLYEIASLAVRDRANESYKLISLYQNLLIDLALDEFDPSWYEQRKHRIVREIGEIKLSTQRRICLETQTRLATLKLGQLVDGRVRKIKHYGVFVDIAGCYALLKISTISQMPIEHPNQVFQVDDWVRAIIVWMDLEKERVLLSTSDLEPEPGDMLTKPFYVYEKAEEMADRYRQHILSSLVDE